MVIEHSLQPSVGLCACLSVCPVQCIMAKQLIGYGSVVPYCNQWAVCGIAVQKCVNHRSCSLGWCMGGMVTWSVPKLLWAILLLIGINNKIA